MLPSTSSVLSLSAITLPFQVAFAIDDVISRSFLFPTLADLTMQQNGPPETGGITERSWCWCLVHLRRAGGGALGQHRDLGDVDRFVGVVHFSDYAYVMAFVTFNSVRIVDGVDRFFGVIHKDRLGSGVDAFFHARRIGGAAIVHGSAFRV